MRLNKLFILLSALLLLIASPAWAKPKAGGNQRYRGVTLSPHITAQDIADLAPYRANVVRYQLAWVGPVNSANEAEYNQWLDGALARLDELLPVFAQNGMKVIIDLHTPPGGFVTEETPAWHRVFAEAWAQDALIRVWQKIAARYRGNTAVWAYDVLNEPAERKVNPGLKNWNALAPQLAAAIRAVDPDHPLIFQPVYGDQARLNRLKPIKMPNIIYSVHMYYLLRFQQQGLYNFPLGVPYPKGNFNKKALLKNLQKVIAYQRKTKAPIYIGEFTAVRWAPGNSAMNYLKDVIGIFEKYKWHWTYHAWRETDAWSFEHDGNINNPVPVNGMTNRGLLMRQAFSKNR